MNDVSAIHRRGEGKAFEKTNFVLLWYTRQYVLGYVVCVGIVPLTFVLVCAMDVIIVVHKKEHNLNSRNQAICKCFSVTERIPPIFCTGWEFLFTLGVDYATFLSAFRQKYSWLITFPFDACEYKVFNCIFIISSVDFSIFFCLYYLLLVSVCQLPMQVWTL